MIHEVYAATVALLGQADQVGAGTGTFVRLEKQRYLLLRSAATADDAMLRTLPDDP